MLPVNQNSGSKRPEFLFLGGHAAVDFANTLLPPPGLDVEFLTSWSDVVNWLKEAGVFRGESTRLSEAESATALETIRTLRNQWKRTLEEILAGREVANSFIEHLNSLLRTHNSHEILHKDRRKGLQLHRSAPTLKGLELAMALLAHTIAEFLATAEFKFLRRCANKHSCVLNFYDNTKNHRRQWCSNATCGNRDKVAKFRRRQRISKNH